ncbi:MarR family transcriptional regulator [Myxococcus sp. K38C18041901]|uniref:MarR family winged helix-turn-helix transcriptional regulator n=1 Tax=Myxococcus guangdongensis TaxID=2906760 RepID=UPI0020A6F782|nr:MarR family transcriptional regulator [Myxococcus guangdongensis]MCP3063800.1 MarR family transcriptional regulator [Myxococcus guangdongensis]
MERGLGTRLRHLLELLDGAVGAEYEADGHTYRPRYTPVMRALLAREPSTLGQIAQAAGITQPAATQTVTLMVQEGLLSSEPGPSDARQRSIRLTEAGRALVPWLQVRWAATADAAARLDEELPAPLSEVLDAAIRALEAKPFGARIAESRERLEKSQKKSRKPSMR